MGVFASKLVMECVCVRVCACARACFCLYDGVNVCVGGWWYVCVCVCVCVCVWGGCLCLCTHFKGSVDHIADMNKDSAVSGNKHFLWSGVCCAGLCSVYFRTASRGGGGGGGGGGMRIMSGGRGTRGHAMPWMYK